ncbi:hypothetical protein [Natrinema sp. DC36]|uniref:hypothetical protein n=1 Tax=Natrinema sp. DC36 TaxID=2878680 RepID=UPI001CF06AF8|nr:hypothetical protein [Natrinema sp. DC36]
MTEVAIDHDVLKRALLESLQSYSERFEESGTNVEVREEAEVTVDGRERRVDVMLIKKNDYSVETAAKYAFEVKTTLGDSVGSPSQLRDYAAADCQPILVAADYLFDENDSLLEGASAHGPVIGVAAHESGQFSFDVISGSLSKTGLHHLSEHWTTLIDYANSEPATEMDPENVSIPWIYRRGSAVEDRDVTKQLHMQKETARQLVEFQNTIEDRLGENIYRADLREACLLAAMRDPGSVVDQLVRWGYNTSNPEAKN